MSGQHDDFRVRQFFLGLTEDLEAVDFSHSQVGHDHIPRFAGNQRRTTFAG